MTIKSKLALGAQLLSFEVFPPKKDSPITSIDDTLIDLAKIEPDFISVTYGAGGGGQSGTLAIADNIQKRHGCLALAHLTCVGADRQGIDGQLNTLETAGIENVLALRGDIPKGMERADAFRHYRHSTDLIAQISKRGGFCIGAAAYPEVHHESETEREELGYLKLKQDAGADFFITQLCFDTPAVLKFIDAARANAIAAPILIGVMPVLDSKQILRMTGMCGCSIPAKLSRLLARYERAPEDFARAGLEFAIEQVRALTAAGVDGVHIYSMNKPEPTKVIVGACDMRA